MTRQWTNADKARFAAERDIKLQALQDQLAQGTTALLQADGWMAWLQVARRFHTYSFRNQVLIALQDPRATQVAGYRAWQALGRQVRRGERGIQILAPVTKPRLDEAGHPVLDPAGRPRRDLIGVKPASVFDITQTDGPPLPAAPDVQSRPLEGPAPDGMWDSLHDYATRLGFTVDTRPCKPEGLTNFTTGQIIIREGFQPAHAAVVLAHEIGHASMHEPEPGTAPITCRGMAEVEAESFAWLVANGWGLDSSTDSFNYLANWATQAAQQKSTTPAEILTATAEKIRGAVTRYLDLAHPNPFLDHPAQVLARQQLDPAASVPTATSPEGASHGPRTPAPATHPDHRSGHRPQPRGGGPRP